MCGRRIPENEFPARQEKRTVIKLDNDGKTSGFERRLESRNRTMGCKSRARLPIAGVERFVFVSDS